MAFADRIRAAAGRVGKAFTFSARTPKPVKGIGLPTAPRQSINDKTVAIANSPEALFGWLSASAGPMLTRNSTYPATALNPATIQAILQEADLGIVFRYGDLCMQVLQRDAHLAGIDRARRVEVSGKPFRIHAANERPTAQALRNFLQAVVDQIDSFDQAIYSSGAANPVGWAAEEIVYEVDEVRFPGINGKSVTIEGVFPRTLEWVHPKHFTFDYGTDAVLIDLGSSGRVPLPPYKFLFHGAAADGFYEHRGYMRQAVWLHMLKHNSIRDWAVFIALYGIPNIFGKIPRAHFENAEFKAIMQAALRDYGQGMPAIIPDDMDIDAKPGPIGSGAADVHARMVAFCNQEQSKLVQGETLTTEMSGTGSYNASSTHEAVKHAIIKMDGSSRAADVRRDLFRSTVELNMDGLCRAFGVPPAEIRQSVSRCSWRIEREITPKERAEITSVAINEWGMEIDEDQMRQEFAFERPRGGSKPLRGKPIAVANGGAAVGSLEAADGVRVDKQQTNQPNV